MNYAPYPQVGALGFVGAVARDRLLPGQQLNPGDELRPAHSDGGHLVFQKDGNLVVYNKAGQAIWNSSTQNKGASRAMMQTDGNFVIYTPSNAPLWHTHTAGHPGGYIVLQDDGNFVLYSGTVPNWQAHTRDWTPPNQSGNVFTDIVHAAGDIVHAVEKIPVVGDIVKITGEAYTAPLRIASNIASGARLDHVALAALKDQIKTVKDAAPYAQTVVSLVPGIGTGVSAAIGAGAALAEGQSITEIGKAAIRGALPGGPLAAAGFDAAMKVASGENVLQSTLESTRNLIPEGPGRKAFDIGLAVITGEKIQTALANGLVSIAPGQMQEILAAGQKALAATPGLANAIKGVAAGDATKGFQIAAGLLSSAGMNEKALTAARNGLPASVRQGFDAALKSQESHIAWLKNVTSAPTAPAAAPAPAQLRTLDPPKRPAAAAPAPLKTLDPPKRAAPAAPAAPAPLRTLDPPKRAPTTLAPPQKTTAPVSPSTPPVQPSAVAPGAFLYAPYPPHIAGALSGPPPDCLSLGPPITDMPGGMRHAGLSAVNGSSGRSRMVHGPDGNDYLFALEGGSLTARRCFSGALNAPPPPHGGHGGGHAHGEHHFSHGGGNRGGHGGWGGGPWNYALVSTQTCRTWGDPIKMTIAMTNAVAVALDASGGRPTTVRGSDGVLYLLAIENSAPTARPCAAVA
jgi:hypothetical protein